MCIAARALFLHRGPECQPGGGLGPPTRREPRPERSGQGPRCFAGPEFCKSPPDCRTAGVWLAGAPRGPAAAASGQGKRGGPRRVCPPHLRGLPPHGGRGRCLSRSVLRPLHPAHGRCLGNPCYTHRRALLSCRRCPKGPTASSVLTVIPEGHC